MTDFSLNLLCRVRRHLLPLTLDTLKSQKGSFEVLILDGEEQGRLKDLIRRYPELNLRVAEAAGSNLAEMMNKGLELSRGKYIQFMEPGDRYISQHGLSYLSELIQQNGEPDIIYTSALFQGAISQVDMTLSRSPWFLRSKLLSAGGFDQHLHLRPTLDLLCRLKQQKLHPLFCPRVLIAPAQPRTPARDLFKYFRETCKIFYRHYGFWQTLKYLFARDHTQLVRRTGAFLKQAFWQDD